MQRKTIQLTEAKIAYYDEGQGMPLMLLHGFPDSADVWRHLIPQFVAKGYRVIAPDLRGFGESELLPAMTDYKIAHLMKDLLELRAVLQISQPMHLIAHDWGANIGWTLVSLYPELFASYVPISVGHPYAYAKDGGFEQQQKGWYTMAFQFEGMAEKMFSQNDWATFRVFTQDNPELDQHWLPDMSRPGRFTAALNLYRANLRPSEERVTLAPAPMPIYGFYGTHDLYLSESQMSQSKKYVAGPFNYQRVEGGHWLPLEKPDILFEGVMSFYAQLAE